jgi:DNA-binding XRE family transcriptional regulator
MDTLSFRKKHNLTAGALAQRLGVDRQTVYNWESGNRKAAGYLGLALEALEAKLVKLSPQKTEAKKSAAAIEAEAIARYRASINDII